MAYKMEPALRQIFLSGLIWLLALAAGVSTKAAELSAHIHERDTVSRFEGRTIDTIAVVPRNIYDTTDPQYRGGIFRLANSLHVVTRRKIVRQEVLFRVGDRYSSELAEELGRNLRASQALNDAWVAPEELPDGRLLVRVITVDRWSLVGGFRARREGNRTNYQYGFEERNLLGFHQFLSFDYFVQEVEDNYILGRFSDRRLWRFPVSLDLQHSGNPLNSVTSSQLSHPYYNLSQHWTYTIHHAFTGGRGDYYRDSIRVASTQLNGDFVRLSAEYRWGPYKNKFALGADYRYVYKSYYDAEVFVPQLRDSVVLPSDSLYHRLGAVAEFSSYEFARVKRITGMQYAEDITLGFTARLEYARAFGPRFHDFAFDDIALQAGYTAKIGGSVVLAAYERSFVLREDAVLRRGNRLAIRYYNTSLPFLTLAVRSLYQSETMADGGNSLILGGESGIRGYDAFFRTGDRRHVLNTELRLFPQLELLTVIFGGALFADFGRTWKRGESRRLFEDYFGSYGAGLRMSLEKISRGHLIRFDLAKSQNGRWNLSIDSHQYF